MSVVEREKILVEEYLLIPDPLERFQLIVETAPARIMALEERHRVEENLVKGCQSSVWLVVWLQDGRIRLVLDSDAPAMRGVGALLVLMYDGSSAADVLSVEPSFSRVLGIEALLTPTRRRGLHAIRCRLRELVEALAAA